MNTSFIQQQIKLAMFSLFLGLLCFSFKATAQADLIISSNIVFKKAPTLHPSSSFSVSATVRNLGNVEAPNSRVRYYLSSDTQYDSGDWAMRTSSSSSAGSAYSSVSSIAAGSYRTVSRTIYVPANFNREGRHYILYRADADGQVTESNESNNVTAIAVDIIRLGPDLTATNATFRNHEGVTNGSLTKGTTGYASFIMQNIGDEAVGLPGFSGPLARIVLSNDATFSSDDTFLVGGGGFAMSPGDSRSVSGNFTIPTSVSTGTKYLIFYADSDDRYNEDNEQNNTIVRTVQIVNAPTQPDLYVDNEYVMTFSGEAEPGSVLFSRVRVYNGGSVSAGSSSLKYYLSRDTQKSSDDLYIGSASVSSISGSSYRTIEKDITIPTNASTGLWYILFESDANSQINESNESNNVGRYSVNIMTSANGPDLTITRAITNPSSVYPGNPITAEFDIKNIGRKERWGSINSGIYLSNDANYSSNDQLLTTYYFETIGAGQTRVCTKSVTIPEGTNPGTKYLIIKADHNNSIYETDENNNTRAIAITILDNTPAPDLIVQYPSAPSSAAQGTSISVSCRVKNQGNASAAGSYVKVYVAGGNTSRWIRTYLGQIYTSSISAGSYRTVSGNVTIPASAFTGNKYLVFVADANKTINESDENNNDTYRAITINQGNTPDLVTSSVNITNPGTVFPAGTTVTVSANIRNSGSANAGSTVVKYYLSQNTDYDSGDTYLASYNLSSLAAGSSQTFSKSITLSSTLIDDGYFILVRADANQQVDEADEFNNVDDVYFTISNGGEPDLTVENAALSPTTINEGGSTVASCRVRNIGSTYTQAGAGSGSGYSSFQLFLSSNTTYDAGDTYLTYQGVGNLAPNAYVNISKTLNIPAGVTGQMYILFVADRYNGINESNENNNVVYIPLYIQAGGVIGKDEFNFRNSANTTENTKVELKTGQNPVVNQTTFTYSLPVATKVNLNIYNLKGVQVASLLNGETKTKGTHQATFYRNDLPAGLYFYRFIANGKLITGKLVVK